MSHGGQPMFVKERGVVLFITLIALVILLIACIALIRSTDTALMISGNLAVKRDLTNQSEVAIQQALANFTSTLATEGSRWTGQPGANYSETALPSNPQGIPNVIVDSNLFASAGFSAPEPAANNGINFLYVIDRMCPKTGSPNAQNCITGNSKAQSFTDARTASQKGGSPLLKAAPITVVYRITVRATDARQTQTYVQTTIRSSGT